MSKVITIFGGSGFIGKYIVKNLAKENVQIRVICRDPLKAKSMLVSGDPGQIELVKANITDYATIEKYVQHSDVVINLIGILYESGTNRFNSVHNLACQNIARVASSHSIKKLIHFSSLGVDKSHTCSKYAETKLKGEQAILEHYKDACIIRPSVVFGMEDNFINKFASMIKYLPIVPIIKGNTKFQPVYVGDVGKAIYNITFDPSIKGKIIELCGPEVLSLKDIHKLILEYTNRKALLLPIPNFIAYIIAAFAQFTPKPLLTIDQVRLLNFDNIESQEENIVHLKDIGINPTRLENILPEMMEIYAKK